MEFEKDLLIRDDQSQWVNLDCDESLGLIISETVSLSLEPGQSNPSSFTSSKTLAKATSGPRTEILAPWRLGYYCRTIMPPPGVLANCKLWGFTVLRVSTPLIVGNMLDGIAKSVSLLLATCRIVYGSPLMMTVNGGGTKLLEAHP